MQIIPECFCKYYYCQFNDDKKKYLFLSFGIEQKNNNNNNVRNENKNIFQCYRVEMLSLKIKKKKNKFNLLMSFKKEKKNNHQKKTHRYQLWIMD